MTLRPQYHFRPTDDGMLIWNVSGLIELARDIPTIHVPLSEIRELDETYWYGRDSTYLPTCRAIAGHMKMVESADMSYPVLLCAEGRLMDGMHRIVKALNLNHETIAAKRFTKTPNHNYKDVDANDLPY